MWDNVFQINKKGECLMTNFIMQEVSIDKTIIDIPPRPAGVMMPNPIPGPTIPGPIIPGLPTKGLW